MVKGLAKVFEEKSAPAKEGEESSDKWEGINEQYERFSTFSSQLFELQSGFVSIVTLFVQTFGIFKLRTSLLSAVCHSSLAILGEISGFNSLMKQQSEKVTSYGADGKDRLKTFVDQFSRSLSWFVGMTAYKLIKVKDEKESEKDKEKKETKDTSSDKMHDMIIQSNLLSGGIENRFLTLFSEEAQQQLEELVKISEDKKLLEMMKSGGKLDEEDELLDSIINAGKNEMVDKLIGYLQQMLERKIPMVPYARLAGVDGMRLSRAALGVMIKFSDYLVDTVHLCKDEIDLM